MFTLSTALQWHLAKAFGTRDLVAGYGILFGMAVLLVLDVPTVKEIRFLGLPLSDKVYTYTLLLQVCGQASPVQAATVDI